MSNSVVILSALGALVGVLALLLWTRRGLAQRLSRVVRTDERVLIEDALKHIFTCQRNGQTSSLESLAGRLGVSTTGAASLLSRLTEMGLVRPGATGPLLTEAGTRAAVRIVRTHRLWERYLADRTGIPASEWHAHAERMEHVLSHEQADELESRLGHPRWDPHGDPIPTSAGDIPPPHGASLVSAAAGATVEVVHLEDEPREIYDALVRDGLEVGSRLKVVETSDRAVRVHAGGPELALDPVKARNVSIRPLSNGEQAEPPRRTLLDARIGETVRVQSLASSCYGPQRRRLLDLGVVRGTDITPELLSAAGDPVAYRIRGALIALRREQAAAIRIEPAGPAAVEVVK